MTNPQIREKSFMTNEQGIIWIDSIIKDIDNCPDLKVADFGISVRSKVVNMKEFLKGPHAFFSMKMETALKNMNTAILKWTRTKQTEQ